MRRFVAVLLIALSLAACGRVQIARQDALPPCPPGFVCISVTGTASDAGGHISGCAVHGFRGSRYVFCPGATNTSAARSACASAGLELLRIDDLEENTFIAGVISGVPEVWTAASDVRIAGVWEWGRGDVFWRGGPTGAAEPGRFVAWGPLHPLDDATQNCMVVDTRGRWTTWGCGNTAAFVCEDIVVREKCDGRDNDGDTMVDEGNVCPASSRAFHDAVTNHGYAFVTGAGFARTWANAARECEMAGLELAAIETSREWAVVQGGVGALVRGAFYWIGAADVSSDMSGEWQWRDGTRFWSGGMRGSPVAGRFSAWSPGHPRDPVAFVDGDQWSTTIDGSTYPFLCETLE